MDSELNGLSSDIFMIEDSSGASHFGSNLEFDLVGKWLVSISSSNLIDVPGLVLTVVAWVVDNPVVVGVSVTIDFKAEFGIVSNVLDSAVVPSDLVVVSSLVWSNSDVVVSSESSFDSVTKNMVSSLPGSQGLSSGIKGPPLGIITWVVVLNSYSELTSAHSLDPSCEEGSVTGKSGLDLEFDSASDWLLWIVVSSLVNDPSLVVAVVALIPVNVSVVSV